VLVALAYSVYAIYASGRTPCSAAWSGIGLVIWDSSRRDLLRCAPNTGAPHDAKGEKGEDDAASVSLSRRSQLRAHRRRCRRFALQMPAGSNGLLRRRESLYRDDAGVRPARLPSADDCGRDQKERLPKLTAGGCR
jgi:hypothetical protein